MPTRLLLVTASALSLAADSLGGRRGAVTIQTFQLSDTSVTGGTHPSALIVLSGLASVNGDTVRISSTPRGSVQHPAFVVVPKGKTQATFTLTTTPTAVTQATIVTATIGASQKSVSLRVRRPTVRSISLSPRSVQGERDTLRLTVALDGAAPSGGLPLSILASPATIGYPPGTTPNIGNSGPASAVPAGATQVILPLRTPAVRLTTTVGVTVEGQNATFELRQPPAEAINFAWPCSPGGITGLQTVRGGSTARVYASVRGPVASDGAFVNLTSSHPGLVVPPSLQITKSVMAALGGISSIRRYDYDCIDLQMPAVPHNTSVTLSATAGGVTRTLSFTIQP